MIPRRVGCIVRIHVLQDVSHVVAIHLIDHGGLHLRVHLLHGLGCGLLLQGVEDEKTVSVVQIHQDIGDIGRMKIIILLIIGKVPILSYKASHFTKPI